LAKFSSVITFADSFKDEARLDILVMNAAVAIRDSREVTSDGWEQGIQVNNLSTSLTTLLLVPKMDKTAKTYGGNPRIVVVSSDLHYWSKIDNADLDAESSFRAISDSSDPE
jgi:NAD(P)-dependent dehydrogenase (short-subunit alcohol dehydrogenase family)